MASQSGDSGLVAAAKEFIEVSEKAIMKAQRLTRASSIADCDLDSRGKTSEDQSVQRGDMASACSAELPSMMKQNVNRTVS